MSHQLTCLLKHSPSSWTFHCLRSIIKTWTLYDTCQKQGGFKHHVCLRWVLRAAPFVIWSCVLSSSISVELSRRRCLFFSSPFLLLFSWLIPSARWHIYSHVCLCWKQWKTPFLLLFSWLIPSARWPIYSHSVDHGLLFLCIGQTGLCLHPAWHKIWYKGTVVTGRGTLLWEGVLIVVNR